MEFNTVTLDMILTLGIKKFSGITSDKIMIEQFNIIGDELHYWDSSSEGWESFFLDTASPIEHLEKYYHSFFTWEIVNNEV